MSLMPAQRLESSTPAARGKGRLQEGADADLVVFDPSRIIDRATYETPAVASEGMQYVLVNGIPVVSAGRLDESHAPGKAVRGIVR